MAGDVQSLDEARRARLAGAGAEGMAKRTAAANLYVTRAEETLALLADAQDTATRGALQQITEAWLDLAASELARLPASA